MTHADDVRRVAGGLGAEVCGVSRHHSGERSPTAQEVAQHELPTNVRKQLADLRAQLGEKAAWLKKLRGVLGVDTNGHAVAKAKGLMEISERTKALLKLVYSELDDHLVYGRVRSHSLDVIRAEVRDVMTKMEGRVMTKMEGR
jgi:hypothetical protein